MLSLSNSLIFAWISLVKIGKNRKIFFRLHFHHEGVEYEKNYFETFFSGSSNLSSCKISGFIFDPFTFCLKNDIFLYNICRKNIFLQNIYGFTPAQKISSKFDQKWVNASQLKKKLFFCLLTLLTYSAMTKTKTFRERLQWATQKSFDQSNPNLVPQE